MRNLKKLLPVLLLLAVAGLYAVRHHGQQARTDTGAAEGPLPLTGTDLERGRYLTAAANCLGCHTAPGGEDFAGGRAFELPFGTLYSGNLTPDDDTGIGHWSEDDFADAVRAGIAPGGRHLYPAHPYTSYAGLARDDVRAIRAYLMSLPAVHQAATPNALAWPFSQRALMALWNTLYQPPVGYHADATRDAVWNRGAYLAGALGHCGECHTPRNALYALTSAHAHQGAVTQGWNAYAITAEGLGSWSAAALSQYLSLGHAPGHGAAVGPMKEVVMQNTAQLSEADRQALVAYLLDGRSEAAVAAPVAQSVAEEGSTGAGLYAGACVGCHQPGPAAPYYADLNGASTVRDPSGTNLLRLLAQGSGHGEGMAVAMPSFAAAYSDAERAALANYVLARFGGLRPALTAKDAKAAGP